MESLKRGQREAIPRKTYVYQVLGPSLAVTGYAGSRTIITLSLFRVRNTRTSRNTLTTYPLPRSEKEILRESLQRGTSPYVYAAVLSQC